MASQSPVHELRPHPTSAAPKPVRYQIRHRERSGASKLEPTESRLGPYETQYPIDMGYAAPPRSVD